MRPCEGMKAMHHDETNPTVEDLGFLRRAVELAARAKASGNPPFGALLVGADGEILAEMSNSTVTDDDVSAHPELKLAVWAAKHLTKDQARTTTLYTSAENCAMCSGGFVLAGLGRLVFAVSAEQAGEARGTPSTSLRISAEEALGRAHYPVVVTGPALVEEGLVVHRP